MEPEPYIVRRGNGEVPVLLVHGWGVDHRLLLDIDDAFDGCPWFERMYIDLPGSGGTPALEGGGDFPSMLSWFDDAVDELIGSRPFMAVGNSMGSLLVRNIVARRPEQCLGFALLAPVINPDRTRRTLPERKVIIAGERLMNSLHPDDAAAYEQMAVVRTPEHWERFRRSVLPGIRQFDEAAGERLEHGYALSSLRDMAWGGFDGSVLVITGRQDSNVGFEDQFAFARDLPHATFVALDSAGHNVQIEQHAVVCALLREWANDIIATR